MPSPTYELILDAMAARRPIHATYQRQHRELCVHEIGHDADGTEKLFSYQFGGFTSKGPVELIDEESRWRCMFLAQLSEVVVVEGPWLTADNRGPGNSCIDVPELVIYP